MTKKTFLTEIGTEELPAKLLRNIAYSFYKNFRCELKLHNFLYENIQWFATPRRLALQVTNLDISEQNIIIKKKGPSISDAFDIHGHPTQAAIRWAKNCNINLNEANIIKNKNGEWLICEIKIIKESILLVLPKIVQKSLQNISITNKMRWNNYYKFFRPIRNILLLLDNNVIPGKIYGIISNNIIYNHVSFKEKIIKLNNAEKYSIVLFNEYKIIANYEIRKKTIQEKIDKAANTINGHVKINSNLIEEVNSIVESPHIFLARFHEKFLIIPEKILIYTLEYHQKCFPIYNQNNKILPYFIFVANINSQKYKNIIVGNEKVINARLSDTMFFLKNDKKITLQQRLPLLKKVLFHKNIGTIYDKTMRLTKLIKWLSHYTEINIENAVRAAILSKCDLISHIVCEFPELQGTIGMYYSLNEGEKKDISIALQEQYLPSFSGDKLPSTIIGSVLAIADKIDTLSGMFIIGHIPTSDKDPFALRRVAIGIFRIIIEKKIDIDIQELINTSLNLYDKNINNIQICNQIIKFFIKRLSYWYEEKGYEMKIIQSISSCKFTKPLDIHKRINAITYFKKLDNSHKIILAVKRISNILKKNTEEILNNINTHLLIEKQEKILFEQTMDFSHSVKHLFENCKYQEILIKSCVLEYPIHNFLNTIQIYHINDNIRINRLALLYFIKKIFFKIANFTFLY